MLSNTMLKEGLCMSANTLPSNAGSAPAISKAELSQIINNNRKFGELIVFFFDGRMYVRSVTKISPSTNHNKVRCYEVKSASCTLFQRSITRHFTCRSPSLQHHQKSLSSSYNSLQWQQNFEAKCRCRYRCKCRCGCVKILTWID